MRPMTHLCCVVIRMLLMSNHLSAVSRGMNNNDRNQRGPDEAEFIMRRHQDQFERGMQYCRSNKRTVDECSGDTHRSIAVLGLWCVVVMWHT
jgi:hypothetical protein